VLALIAMLYGLAVLGVFACFAAIERRRGAAAAGPSEGGPAAPPSVPQPGGLE